MGGKHDQPHAFSGADAACGFRPTGEVPAMSRQPVTWYVVADGAHARMLVHGDDGFTDVTSLDSIDAQHDSSDLGSDRPGRAVESSGVERHAVEPHTDLQKRAKREFGHVVAEVVNEAAERGAFAQFVLVAPPKTIHAIKEALTGAAAEMLVAEQPKDFIKLSEKELRDRLFRIDTRRR
jgi:protein required for attachment to host cells